MADWNAATHGEPGVLDQNAVDAHLAGTNAYDVARLLVSGYTRGVGFEAGLPYRADLSAVVVAVAGRLRANPSGLRKATTIGEFSEDIAGWQGFTLAERTIMDRYRVRAV